MTLEKIIALYRKQTLPMVTYWYEEDNSIDLTYRKIEWSYLCDTYNVSFAFPKCLEKARPSKQNYKDYLSSLVEDKMVEVDNLRGLL
jgi:hypothetical protein